MWLQAKIRIVSTSWPSILAVVALTLSAAALVGCSKDPEVSQATQPVAPPPPPSEDSFGKIIVQSVVAVAPGVGVPDANSLPPDEDDAPKTDEKDPAATSENNPDSKPASEGDGDKPMRDEEPPLVAKSRPKRNSGMPATELPTATSADDVKPLEIGPVVAPDDESCTARLLGGDMALPGPGAFVLHTDSNDPAVRKWVVTLEDESNDPPSAKVAEFVVRKNKVWFRWATDAITRNRADYLRNCILQVNVNSQSHNFALRQPIKAEKLAVKFLEATNVEWKIPHAPDPKSIRVDFDFPAASFQATSYTPRDVLTAYSDITWAVFGDKDKQGFRLKLASKMKEKDKLQVEVVPHFRLANDPHNVRMNPTAFNQAEIAAPRAIATIEKRITELQSQPAQAAPVRSTRGRTSMRGPVVNHAKLHAEQAQRARRDLEEAKIAQEQINGINSIRPNIERDGTFEMRVFYEIEGMELDLMTSSTD